MHHDINEGNLLLREDNSGSIKIAGLLDFQDACYGKRHYDISIYMLYMMVYFKGEDNVGYGGGLCLKGFLEEATLSDVEMNLLYYTVIGRLVQSLILGSYSYSLYKDPYHLSTSHTGWQLLKALWSKPAEQVLAKWLSVAQSK